MIWPRCRGTVRELTRPCCAAVVSAVTKAFWLELARSEVERVTV
jgi:hypothetical protein